MYKSTSAIPFCRLVHEPKEILSTIQEQYSRLVRDKHKEITVDFQGLRVSIAKAANWMLGSKWATYSI